MNQFETASLLYLAHIAELLETIANNTQEFHFNFRKDFENKARKFLDSETLDVLDIQHE